MTEENIKTHDYSKETEKAIEDSNHLIKVYFYFYKGIPK